MKEENIRALMVAPGNRPVPTLLKNELDALQQAVSIGTSRKGLIEVLYPEPGVCLVCHEEGKLIPLQGNRHIGDDIIAGVFYIVGDDNEGNFCSLSEDAMKKYAAIFWEPEDITMDEVLDAFWMQFEAIP
jgi:hypothetical protein